MPLKHQLRGAGSGIPELHAAVLGPGDDPLSIRCEGNRKNKVLRLVRFGMPCCDSRIDLLCDPQMS